MMTGELKKRIDGLWDIFAAGGLVKPLGVFVREIVGMDRNAAKEAFSEYLSDAGLDSSRIYFVNQIVECIVLNDMLRCLSVWAGIRRVIGGISANA